MDSHNSLNNKKLLTRSGTEMLIKKAYLTLFTCDDDILKKKNSVMHIYHRNHSNINNNVGVPVSSRTKKLTPRTNAILGYLNSKSYDALSCSSVLPLERDKENREHVSRDLDRGEGGVTVLPPASSNKINHTNYSNFRPINSRNNNNFLGGQQINPTTTPSQARNSAQQSTNNSSSQSKSHFIL